MNNFKVSTLKTIRKVYTACFGKPLLKPEFDQDPDSVSYTISEKLESTGGCMIARLGSTELSCIKNYLGIKKRKNLKEFLQNKTGIWWWDKKILEQMQAWSGFFPPTEAMAERFCELYIKDIPDIDVLGSWLADERLFENELQNSVKVQLELLNPFFAKEPWTKALKNKKVLVVHPFAETIEQQYKKRNLIFPNGLLPEFQLKTIKAVQSLGKHDNRFSDWFEALRNMECEIEKQDFDICLIGCGAYGLPLAAHVKRLGKKAVHLGGSLQLLFGIRGKRWENPNYNPIYNYAGLMNQFWVKPLEEERPINANKVEGACYW